MGANKKMKRKLIALLLIVMMVSVFPAFAAENDSGPDTQETEIELKTENAEAVVHDTESNIEDTTGPVEELQDEDVEELNDKDVKEPEESKKVEEKKPEVVKEDKNEEKSSEKETQESDDDSDIDRIPYQNLTKEQYLRSLKKLNVLAIKLKANSSLVNGTTYEYSNPFNGDPDLGWYDFRIGDYVGECVNPDLAAAYGDMPRTARVTKLSNTDDIAKSAYYWGVVKGWRNGNQLVSDFDKQIFMLRVIQYSALPYETTLHMNSSEEATVKSMYAEAQSVTVPSSFEIYRCTPADSSVQPFVVWRMAPTINLVIKKTVDNSKITSKNGLYDVKGTKFKLYETESDAKNDKNAVVTLTIGEDGKSSTVQIDRGSYYLVETQAGPGLIIPNDLKKANAGKKIDCNGPTTINIS